MSTSRLAQVLAGILAVGALTVLPSSSAAAAPPDHGTGKNSPLSSRLQEVNADPGMTTQEVGDETSTPPDGPGSLLKYDAERYLVDIRVAQVTDDVVDRLGEAGALITHQNPDLRLVTAGVKANRLDEVANVDGVEYIADILTPITHCGITTSEGDQILNAEDLRGAPTSVDATGVGVGILSDSFARLSTPTSAAGDVASGDLPGSTNPCSRTTPVSIQQEGPAAGAGDEGRAMAQIVHDLAPGATLSFRTAFNGQSSFAANIEALAAAGADVIVDDVTYFAEPFYQPGIIDNAIAEVTADGVQYFSSAGNSNVVVGGNDVGSYEAMAYRPASCPSVPGSGLIDCHNFDPSGGTDNDFDLTLKPGEGFVLDLQWAQPHFAVTSDIDLFILSPAGTVLASSDDNNLTSDEPVEVLSYDNETASDQDLRIVIGRFTGPSDPRLKFVFVGSSDMLSAAQATTAPDVAGPTIFGHNGGADTISVAAQSVQASGVNSYSSHGPVTHLFQAVSGDTPSAPLAAALILPKPDLTASDCNVNTFFGGGSPRRFCGTSAAAPHAAAVGALLHAIRPTASPAQVLTALKASAFDRPAVGPLVEGAGLIDAAAAGADAAFLSLPANTQTISFDAPASGTVGAGAALTASSSSGLPVTLAVAPASAAICAVSGATVSYLSAGSCTIVANQAGNSTYSAAPQVQDAIAVLAATVPPPPPPPPPAGGGGSPGTTGSCGGKRATITGTSGRDTIRGTNGRDVIDARGGNDKISGRGGNDIICGGNGNDTIGGNGGKDKLYGGAGRDALNGGSGRDSCSGGAGRDTTSSC